MAAQPSLFLADPVCTVMRGDTETVLTASGAQLACLEAILTAMANDSQCPLLDVPDFLGAFPIHCIALSSERTLVTDSDEPELNSLSATCCL